MPKRRKIKRYLKIPLFATPWRINLAEPLRQSGGKLSPVILVMYFAGLIVIGAILLILPLSSRSGQVTQPIDALFTAASAVCVTGLVVVDTANHWSFFGQAVILVLIQLGGLGFMTTATLFFLTMGRHIGLREKLLMVESLGITRLGGITNLIKRIAIFTFASEAVGTILFFIRFSTFSTSDTPVWQSLFLAVSAFNNAGFDLFGNFNSLKSYSPDAFFLLTIAVLTILGGISYLVVFDVFTKRKFSAYSLDTKFVLIGSAVLLAGGTAVILLTEFANPLTLGSLELADRLLVSFFQSAVARTSGFTNLDMSAVTPYCLFFVLVLMFIGGAAGSTAGGVKVNTFGILTATVISSLKGKENAGAFGREFISQQVFRALAVVILALSIISMVVFILTISEPFDFLELFFETVSAFANVGLSTGITPSLSLTGRIVIIVTMFVGRLGPLTLALSLVERQKHTTYRLPRESVRIG